MSGAAHLEHAAQRRRRLVAPFELVWAGGATGAIYNIARLYGGAGIDPATAGQMATATLVGGVSTQALTLAFDDVFRLSAWLSLACLLIVPFCRGGPLTQGPRNGAH